MTMWQPMLEGRPGPRYLALAQALVDDVVDGRLAPGARLPTHRDLADHLGVTVGTVSRAYSEAARRGLVSVEVGRGTFVRGRAAPDLRLGSREPGIIDLSQHHPPPFCDLSLRQSFEKAVLALSHHESLEAILDYPAEGGNAGDREAGAAWLSRTGLDARPENVLVCSGSQHGMVTVLATLLEPGDLLLTEELTYPGLKAVAGLLHLRLRALPLDDDGLRPNAFEQACRTSSARVLYIVPTIQNPTASVMSLARRQQIAAIARAQGVAVVEDDIHALLPTERPAPITAFAPETSYYLMSTSKTLVPGLRIAYVLSPPGHFARLAGSLRATVWAAPPLMAALASAWIRDRTADTLLEDRRKAAAARQARAHTVLAGARFEAHAAGYFLWLHLPEPWRSDTFAAEVRARGVAVTPAEAFAVGRSPVPHAVRVCLGGARNEDELERGLHVIAEVLAGGREAGAAIV